MEAFVVVVAIVGCVCGIIGACIGEQKDAGGAGFMLGLLFGPIGLLLSFFLDARPRCPHCSERLFRDAKVCPRCRNDVLWHDGNSYRSAATIEKIKADEHAKQVAQEEFYRKQDEADRKAQEALEKFWREFFGNIRMFLGNLLALRTLNKSTLAAEQESAELVVKHNPSSSESKQNAKGDSKKVALSILVSSLLVAALIAYWFWNPILSVISNSAVDVDVLKSELDDSSVNDVTEIAPVSDVVIDAKNVESASVEKTGNMTDGSALEGSLNLDGKEANPAVPRSEASGMSSATDITFASSAGRFKYAEWRSVKELYEDRLKSMQSQYVDWLESAHESAVQEFRFNEADHIRKELSSFTMNQPAIDGRSIWVYPNGFYQVLHDGMWFEREPNGTTTVFREVRRTKDYVEIQFKTTTWVRLFADRAEVKHLGMRTFHTGHVGRWE